VQQQTLNLSESIHEQTMLHAAHSEQQQLIKLSRTGVNLKTGDDASQSNPLAFLQRHRRRITVVISRDNWLFLSARRAHVRVHTIGLGLGDSHTATVVPVIATVTANVEPDSYNAYQSERYISHIYEDEIYSTQQLLLIISVKPQNFRLQCIPLL